MKRKKLSVIIFITFLCVVLIGFFACGETELCNIFTEVENRQGIQSLFWGTDEEVIIVSSTQQFHELIIQPDFWTEAIERYTEKFFENYVLAIVTVRINFNEFALPPAPNAGAPKPYISFYTVVVNNGYLRFIFRNDSTAGWGSNKSFPVSFPIELPKELMEQYAIERATPPSLGIIGHSVRMINNRDPNFGSFSYPSPFKGIIHYLDGRQVEFPLAAAGSPATEALGRGAA